MTCERQPWLDVLRGAALLGIAQINFPSFASGAVPTSALLEANAPLSQRLLYGATMFFISAKFYPIFSFLFGYGHALQLQRPGGDGKAARLRLKRRYLVLLSLGIAHGLLLFFGDILTMYALAGLVLLRGQSWGWGDAGRQTLAWGAISLVLLVLSVVSADPARFSTHADWIVMHRAELAQLSSGQLFPVLIDRAGLYIQAQLMQLGVFLPQVLMFMSAGMWCAERGVWRTPGAHRGLFKRALWVGLALGVPLNLALSVTELGILDGRHGGLALVDALQDLAFLQSLAYLGALGLVASAWPSAVSAFWPLRWLSAAGRMALTNYLTQSVLMALIWYLAFAAIDQAGALWVMALLALAITLVQYALAAWLMRRFRHAPAEWLWRRLTDGRPVPPALHATRASTLD